MESSCYQQNKARRPFTYAQWSSCIHHDTLFPMLKEYLADVIDELVSVSNRHKINSLLEKFDTKATKVHHMMQQAHQDMVATHMDCVNAIRDVLSGHDNGDLDDNDNIHDEGTDAEAQLVHDNVQQTTNAAMDALLQRD
jgi:hypothetical protein